MDSPHKMLYSKVDPFSFSGLPARDEKVRSLRLFSLWGDLGGKISERSDKKNLLGTFKRATGQVSAGISLIESADISLGVYASYAKTQMKQGFNKANVQSAEGGVYGGKFGARIRHKYFAAVGFHDIATARRIDLGYGYAPTAKFNLYSFKAGGETAFEIAKFGEFDLNLFGGLTGGSVYNDDIKEEGGGPVGLKVRHGSYDRLDSYAGIRVGKRWWNVSLEAGYLLYGNFERARFPMYMDGLNYRMHIEGSNVDPISFGVNYQTEKRLSPDFYVQGLAGFSVDKDLGSRKAYANVSVKYLLPTRRHASAYRELQGRYLYSEKEQLGKGRREKLLDKHTGWATTHLDIGPDTKAEDRLQKSSTGRNRMVVHVLVENKNGQMEWQTFMITNMNSFANGSDEVPTGMKALIKEKLRGLDKQQLGISRVRIMRYGHFIDEKEEELARKRAENVYKEMRLDRSELDRLEHERAVREEADRQKKEADRLEALKRKEEAAARKQIEEAEARRKKSIASFKLKAATFQTGLAILSREAYNNIDAVAREILGKDFTMITVEGHTDSTGSEEKNLRLSEERALAVYSELVVRGIPRDKLKIAYFGSSMPVDTNLTVEGRAANRRVEIFVE